MPHRRANFYRYLLVTGPYCRVKLPNFVVRRPKFCNRDICGQPSVITMERASFSGEFRVRIRKVNYSTISGVLCNLKRVKYGLCNVAGFQVLRHSM